MTILERPLATISLKDYETRKPELVRQLLDISSNDGFFALTDCGITAEEIETMFSLSKQFFALPTETKSKYPFERTKNAGWESNSQLRPSTGTYDMKESLQLQYASLTSEGKWPSSSDCPDFETVTKRFMEKCNKVSYDMMRLFAIGLEFEDTEWFSKVHDINKGDSMSTLRCILYHDTEGKAVPEGHWRAGAHTDFDVLTLLFQYPGQSGLEICPGRLASTSFAHGDIWTPVHFPSIDTIVCNIGDMLMHLSSDRFKSTFHRVRAPREGERGERYSLAWFNQPCRGTRIKDKAGRYDECSAEEFILGAMRRNYEAHKGGGTDYQPPKQ